MTRCHRHLWFRGGISCYSCLVTEFSNGLSFFRAALLVSALFMASGCAEAEGETFLPPLAVESVSPRPVLPGSVLVLRGSGFSAEEVATLKVALLGQVNGEAVEWIVEPTRIDGNELQIPVEGELAQILIPQQEGTFEGHIAVTRDPLFDREPSTASLALSLPVAKELTPVLNSMTPTIFRPGDVVQLSGSGFLFPTEGTSSAVLDGVLRTDSPALEVPVEGLEVAIAPEDLSDRGLLKLPITAAIFGIRPATFDGAIQVINYARDGGVTSSNVLEPGALRLEGPELQSFTPLEASRGQRVDVQGRGLLPANPLEGSGTIFLLEGVLDADRGPSQEFTTDHPLGLFPDAQASSEHAELILRVRPDEDGLPTGLGATSGLFEGQVRPMLFYGAERYVGPPHPLTFRVLPAIQHVYLQFLPAFDEALVAFGLLHARSSIISRVLAVTARDYEGVNIAFSSAPPKDFAEYMIVEVGGEDPNGTGLFGLDNTSGKDVGNLRFDEVIGGFNADTRARGFAAYGGIFASEFLNLSLTFGTSGLADPRFDTIFSPFCPDLGGLPAQAEEVSGAGARVVSLKEAVRVLGNLIGSTITHEVGHSLGLSAQSGSFHNSGDTPGWIMDAGQFRPFGERAELSGEGPAVFSPTNRSYLEEVLRQ
jgi:hypothetical protein